MFIFLDSRQENSPKLPASLLPSKWKKALSRFPSPNIPVFCFHCFYETSRLWKKGTSFDIFICSSTFISETIASLFPSRCQSAFYFRYRKLFFIYHPFEEDQIDRNSQKVQYVKRFVVYYIVLWVPVLVSSTKVSNYCFTFAAGFPTLKESIFLVASENYLADAAKNTISIDCSGFWTTCFFETLNPIPSIMVPLMHFIVYKGIL